MKYRWGAKKIKIYIFFLWSNWELFVWNWEKHTFWHWEWGRISVPKSGDREPCYTVSTVFLSFLTGNDYVTNLPLQMTVYFNCFFSPFWITVILVIFEVKVRPNFKSSFLLRLSSDLSHLLLIFANSLDLDQDQQNIGPDLDPNC